MKSKRSKYGNKKVTYLGLKFDSKLELKRWQHLCEFQKQGKISGLKRQEVYPLIAGDKLICDYIADFDYILNGNHITEDTKGVVTAIFRIKAKLFEAFYLRKIKIVKDGQEATL